MATLSTQLKRTWPIGETHEVLNDRWRALLAAPPESRGSLFRETRDRTVLAEYPKLIGTGNDPALAKLDGGAPPPEICAYAFRSFDRQLVLRDARLGDRNRPVLHRVHSEQQVYITSLLTAVLGHGPAAVASEAIPDMDHFRGSFGAKHVIPLWRDADATQPNVTQKLLEAIGIAHGTTVSAESLFSYAYGILAQPTYVERFWDELELPPPRLPITRDGALFQRVAEHGARLLNLHTYGKRFGDPGTEGSVPQGTTRCTKSVQFDTYPESFSYDPKTKVLQVGVGEFAPVSQEVWEYSVSGLQVVKSWLDRRKLNRSGRKSSPLDEIRPERWDFTEELLELLWVLESTLKMQPEGAKLLDEVCASDLFSSDQLPNPTDEERQPPLAPLPSGGQLELLAQDSD